MLLITEGTGYYRERGQPVRVVHKGDVIKSAPGVEHWHTAAPDSTFAYIAVTPTQKGKTIWLKPVTEEEYRSAKQPRTYVSFVDALCCPNSVVLPGPDEWRQAPECVTNGRCC